MDSTLSPDRAAVREAVAPLAARFVKEHQHSTEEQFSAALIAWAERLRGASIKESGLFNPSGMMLGQEFVRAAVIQWNAEAEAEGSA